MRGPCGNDFQFVQSWEIIYWVSLFIDCRTRCTASMLFILTSTILKPKHRSQSADDSYGSYPRCICGFVKIRWSLNMTRRTIPFGAAVVTIALKLIRQLDVSIRRALSVAITAGQRFDGSALKTLPPKRLYTGWALINDNFCDFIAAAVAVPVVRCIDVDAIAFDGAAVTAAATIMVRLFCVDMFCIAIVLFRCNNEMWRGVL